MKIKIIVLNKIKDNSPEGKMIFEYLKRIKEASVSIIELKDANISSNPKSAEAELIKKHIKDNDYIICLDEHGDNLTSKEFSKVIEKQSMTGKNIAFIIGGAFGIDESILNSANKKIAFGKCTYPHKLVRIMLIEQIYRAFSIINNHPYHKE